MDGRPAGIMRGAAVVALALLLAGPALVLVPAAPAADPGPWLVIPSTRTGNGDIYAMSVSTGALQQLTSSPDREDQPRWSWDGSTIAYRRRRDIWTMQVDGSGQTNRTPGTPSREQWPFWLPAGRLGFSSDVSGVEELYVLEPPNWVPLNRRGRKAAASRDGGSLCYTRNLEVYWALVGGGPEHNISQWEGSDHDCIWDPTVDDPMWLLIHSHRAAAVGPRVRTGRIWRVDRSGVFVTPPVTEGSDNTEGDNYPAWHASGWIAWSRHIGCTPDLLCGKQRDKMELFAMDPAGTITRLTTNTVEDSEPHFQP